MRTEELKALRQLCYPGRGITCVEMDQVPAFSPAHGKVNFVDNEGRIHVFWDTKPDFSPTIVPATDTWFLEGQEALVYKGSEKQPPYIVWE